MPRLSVIIITRDEAKNIAECLASTAFCDECIVVDSGSEDNTVELATSKGARVVHRFGGFGLAGARSPDRRRRRPGLHE